MVFKTDTELKHMRTAVFTKASGLVVWDMVTVSVNQYHTDWPLLLTLKWELLQWHPSQQTNPWPIQTVSRRMRGQSTIYVGVMRWQLTSEVLLDMLNYINKGHHLVETAGNRFLPTEFWILILTLWWRHNIIKQGGVLLLILLIVPISFGYSDRIWKSGERDFQNKIVPSIDRWVMGQNRWVIGYWWLIFYFLSF